MAKNRHIPHATAGRKSHSLRAVVLTAALLACVTAAVQPAQAQTATYELTDRDAYEPSSSSAGDADTGTFTITLSNLNVSQMNLPRRRFHFRLEALGNSHPTYETPGYGSAASGIDASNLASRSDFTLSVEFRSGFTPHPLVTESLEFDMPTGTITASHVKAEGGGTEVYTFRVTPTHDDNDEGMQPLLFGYRVNFVDGAEQDVDALRLTGVVNGASTVPAMIIGEADDAPSAEFVNICDRTEEVEDAILTLVTETNCMVVPTSQLRAITDLNLMNIMINDTLQGDDFANLPNLQTLNLSNTRLVSSLQSPLPAELFGGLSNLVTLNLSSNRLETLPAGLFDGLSNLVTLNLSFNRLQSLPAGLFDGLSNLVTLNLRLSRLESLPAGLFDGLSNLRTLELAGNNLNNPPLPAGLFNDVLDTLTSLSLNNTLEATVSIGPSAAVMVPNTTQTLTAQLIVPSPVTVRVTILGSNNDARRYITFPSPATVTIPGGMTTATFDITLAGNPAAGTTGGVILGRPITLPYINTSGEEQENGVSGVITSLVNSPVVRDNTFTFIVAALAGPTVNICDRTPEVEAAIRVAARVTGTNCMVVPQASLDTVDGTLTVEGVGLTTLRVGDFANLGNLVTLNLNNNNLESLPAGLLDGLSNLQTLNLSNNNLESLPAGLLDGLSILRTLNLDTNPLNNPPLPVGLFENVLDTLDTLTLDSSLRASVSIAPPTATIARNGIQTLTVQLRPPSPATVRLTIIKGGDDVEVGHPPNITIPGGMMSETFDITLTGGAPGSTGTISFSNFSELRYTDNDGDIQSNTLFSRSLVDTQSLTSSTHTFTVAAAPPTVEFTRNRDITSVNEPVGEDTLIIQFDYTIDNIPASSSFTSLVVRFGTLDPNDVLIDSGFPVDPIFFEGILSFDGSFVRYTYTNNRYVPTTFSDNIQYQIEADNNATDDDFNLGITSVVLSGGSGDDITIPGADILVPGGRHVMVGGTTYAVQTITIRDAQATSPMVTLTRDRDFIEEGMSTPAIFTLALTGAPDGPATVTYTLAVSGGDNPDNGDISAEFGGAAAGETPVIGGSGDTFTINVSGTTTATLAITPENDSDVTNETATFTITGIEVDSLSLGPDDLECGDCSLAITVTDNLVVPDPSVTYTLTDSEAFEPANAGADANPGLFTLTLSNLNDDQRSSTDRRFFFRFSFRHFGDGVNQTPGYGSSYQPILSAPRASPSDVKIQVEYMQPGTTNLTVHDLSFSGNTYDTPTNIPKAGGDTEEVYTFRVIPRHDNNSEGIESVVFGYRVFFSGIDDQGPSGDNRLEGTVNSNTAATPPMPAMTIANAPIATLTRDRNSIEEGISTPAIFTLALTGAPDGPATVTYTLSVSGGGNTLDNGNISAAFGGAADGTPVIDGNGDTFTITVSGNNNTATLAITPGSDTDTDGEIVTLTITGIEVAGLSLEPVDLVCDDCSPTGALDITVTDAAAAPVPDPSVTYTLTDSEAFEPANAGADANPGLFTLTLSNLNDDQSSSTNRRFFFRFSFRHFGDGVNQTPGYGSSYQPILSAPRAGPSDVKIQVEYMRTGDTNLTVHELSFGGNTYDTPNIPKAGGDTEEVYTFRVIPRHDNNSEEIESVVFGYRVFFSGIDDQGPSGDNRLEGTVNSNTAATPPMPAMTIADAPIATLTLDSNSIEEGISTPAIFTLALTGAPDDPATVTYTLAVSGGDNPDNGDISATFGGAAVGTPVIGGSGDTFTINVNGNNTATLAITPENDSDMTNETATFTITGIEVAGLSLVADDLVCPDEVCPGGALAITVNDDDAVTAVYNSDDDIELTEGSGAGTTRTIMLTNAPDSTAVVSFTFADGTANNGTEPDINFSVSGGEGLTLNADGTTGTFTIPRGTAAATLTFTANPDSDGTAELLTFTITGIVFGDGVTVTPNDLPEPLTISITDPTPSNLTVSVSDPVIRVGETTTVTFALSNIPARVVHTNGDNVVVLRTEFSFTGFPLPSTFSPNSGDSSMLTFVGGDYDLTISDNIDNWRVSDRGSGELVVNILPAALTDEAATVTLTVVAKAPSMLTAIPRLRGVSRGRVDGNNNQGLKDAIVTGDLRFTIEAPTAAYVSAADVAITEGSVASTTRTIMLTNAPAADATATFTLAGGTTADVVITVGGGADNLEFTSETGGTFRIPNGDSSVTITFTPAVSDGDADDETITFSITGIDFADTDNDITSSLDLVINIAENINEPGEICRGRTVEVHTAIRNAIDSGSPPECNAVSQAQLNTVTNLDLSGAIISSTSLRTGDFARLTNLMQLSLDNNALEGLDPDQFSGLTSLRNLFLNNNALEGLDSNQFSDLTNLVRLDLNNNALEGLDPGQFSGLTSLTRLGLNNNALTSLDFGLFAGLIALRELRLHSNALATLHEDVFTGLSLLTLLTLHEQEDSANQRVLSSLPVGLFSGLTSLTRLRLHNNDLTGLLDGLFDGLNALMILELNGNQNLTSLSDGLLDDVLDTLTSLSLDPRLQRTLDLLSVDSNDLPQGRGVFLRFSLGTPMEAGLGVRVPYTAVFGGGGTADDFIGLSDTGTVDISPGMADMTIDITATPTATLRATATITLGVPSLLYGSDQVKSTPNIVVSRLVTVGTTNAQTITITPTPPEPTSITAIFVTNDPVPEGDPVAVRIILNQPLPENGGISFSIAPREGSSMPIDGSDNLDIPVSGPPGFVPTPRAQTINFLTNQRSSIRIADDDNHVEPDLEEGKITILAITWGRNFTESFAPVNNVANFSIEDNDAINLTLGIEDNADIPVTLIAGEYQVRVRESTTTLDVIIRADPAPIPPDSAGVVLDRSITATLTSSSDGTDTPAVNGTDFTFLDLTNTYSSIEEGRAQSTFTSVIATIDIHDRNSAQEKEFTLALRGETRVANLKTPHRARVIIVPDTSADYNSTADITITDGVAGAVERILTLRHSPSTDATVEFAFSGGKIRRLDVADASLVFSVGGGGGVLAISEDGTTGSFTVFAGRTTATLSFADNEGRDSAGETIGFTITGITFDDPGTVTDIAGLDQLNIILTATTSQPGLTLVATDNMASEVNNDPAVATLTLINAATAGTATVSFELSGATFGTRLPGNGFTGDDADYLLDITIGGNVTNATTTTGTFVLPPAVREAAFRIIPIADGVPDFETVAVVVTTVTFSNENAPPITTRPTVDFSIVDYGTLPTAFLGIRSIEGDNPATPGIDEGDSITTSGIDEGGDSGLFILDLRNVPNGPGIAVVTYDLDVDSDAIAAAEFGFNATGTAVIGTDNTFMMDVANRRSTATLTITSSADDADDDEDIVVFIVTSITFNDIGTGTDIGVHTHNFRINDDDPSSATVAIDDMGIINEDQNIGVTVTLVDRVLPQAGMVHYRILPASSGAAIDSNDVSSDLFGSGGNNSFAASEGEQEITFTVDVADDNRVEQDTEGGIVRIVSVTWGDHTLDIPATLPFTITDNDGITLALDADEYRVRDNAGALDVAVIATPNPIPSTHNGVVLDRAVAAMLVSTDGTATEPDDYTAVNETLTFNSGDSLNNSTISITIIDDVNPGDQTFTLDLEEEDRAVTLVEPNAATVTIIPNVLARYATGTDTDIALTEGGASTERTLTLVNAPNAIATVEFRVTGGTVAGGSAADPSLALTVGADPTTPTINAGGTGGSFTIPRGMSSILLTFAPFEDANDLTETIRFTIDRITFADDESMTDITALSELTIEIRDTVARTNSVLVAVRANASEVNNTPATATLTLVGPDVSGEATASFALTGSATFGTRLNDGNFDPAEADYLLDIVIGGTATPATGSTGTLTLPDGERQAHFRITPIADAADADEGAEDVAIAVSGITLGGAALPDRNTTLTITDYGPLPTAEVRDTSGDELEGGSATVYSLGLRNAPVGIGIAEVAYTLVVTGDNPETTDITAVFGEAASAVATVVVGTDNTTNTFTMDIGNPVVSTATLTITPDDDADMTGETVTFTVIGITFTDIGDGTDIEPEGLNFSFGITDDDLIVTEAAIDGATRFNENQNINVIVTLNESLPEDGMLRYTILPAGSGTDIAAHDVSAANFGATNFNDMPVSEGQQAITFTAGVADDDNRVEQDTEAGIISIANIVWGGNRSIDVNADLDFTIVDNDKIRLSVADQTVSENTGSFGYTVAATAAPVPDNPAGVVLDRAVTAILNSADISTMADDYNAVNGAAVVFSTNAATQTDLTSDPVSITVMNDGEAAAEEFVLTLTSTNDMAVEIADEDSTAAITIAPDPSAVFGGGDTVALVESGAPVTRTLTVSGAPGSRASVSFGVSGGRLSISGDPADDFILGVASAPGVTDVSSLILSANNTIATFTIPADNFTADGTAIVTLTFTPIVDTDTELESISFSVTNIRFPDDTDYNGVPQSPGLTINIDESEGVPSAVTEISIDDDDDNPVDALTSTITESGAIFVTITLDNPIPAGVADAMVAYVVEPRGTAPISVAADTADTAGGGSVPIDTEASELTFRIEITEDNRIEFNEQGLVRIASVVWNGGADRIQPADSTAGFTINDNDKIEVSTPTATVSENIGTFEYTVMATAEPVPDNAAGVILDRDLTMSLNSVNVSAFFGVDYTDIMTTTVVFPANTVAQTNLIGTPAIPITINNDGGAVRQQFTLGLSTSDAAVLLEANFINIFIAPDPVSAFAGGETVALAESDGTPATRTLTVSRAPGSTATVSLGVSGGTVSLMNNPAHNFILGVASAPGVVTNVSDLAVLPGNTTARFTIPADNFIDGTAIVTLTFTPIVDTNTESEIIAFGVAGIQFPDDPDYNVGAQSPGLTITVNIAERPPSTIILMVTSEQGGDPMIVETDSSDGSGPDDTAMITLTVSNVPADATEVGITYDLAISGASTMTGDITVTGASVGTSQTLTLNSIDRVAATARAVITVTANDDDDEDDEIVTFTVTALSFTGAPDANRTELTDSVAIEIDDNDGGICDRTDAVEAAILAAIVGDITCANALQNLGEVNTLTLTGSGLSNLVAGDFDGLINLRELRLDNNNALGSLPAGIFDGLADLRELHLDNNTLTPLPAGIFDDVLDTLTVLEIDDDLKGRLSFAGPSGILHNVPADVTVQLSPAFVSVGMAVDVAFGGGGDSASFGNPSPLTFTLGSSDTSSTIRATAAANAPIGATATFTFGGITLRYGNGLQSLLRASSLVVPDSSSDTHTLDVEASVTLDSSSQRPAGSPDRNVPEGDAGDEGFFTFRLNTDIIPASATTPVRVEYKLPISGGDNALRTDVSAFEFVSSNVGFIAGRIPVIGSEGTEVVNFTDVSSDFLTFTFNVGAAFDADLTDETLTFEVVSVAAFISGGFSSIISNAVIHDADGNDSPYTADLILWDPGTARIAAGDTDIAEDEATTFTVTLAGLRTPDSEGRDVDHWPVRVNFPVGTTFTKSGLTLASTLYDIEISGDVSEEDIAVPADAVNAIVISVEPAARERTNEVITYTFMPKRGAGTNASSVEVMLADLAGVTVAGTQTNSIYVPNDANNLTFNITEPAAEPPSAVTGISIDDDDNPGDGITSTIAESDTIVVTVVLDNPLPAAGTISYSIVPDGGDLGPGIMALDVVDGNVGEDAENTVGVGVQEETTYTFTVNVMDDNRIEPFMEHGRIQITGIAWNDDVDISGSFTPGPAASATFTITDNDQVALSILDASVRDSAGTLTYTVTAAARPQPAAHAGVILDREVTALLSTVADGDAMADVDYASFTSRVVTFSTTSMEQSVLMSEVVSIVIIGGGEDEEEEETFILRLDSSVPADPAVILPTDDTATVTILPAVTAGYDSTATITLIEGESTVRTLTLTNAPGTTATVSFALTGEANVRARSLTFTAGDSETEAMNNRFIIPAAASSVSLTFAALIDADSDDSTIMFTITDIAFEGDDSMTDITALDTLTITITDTSSRTDAVLNAVDPDVNASEINNATADAVLTLIGNAAVAGTATVSFELGDDAVFGTRSDGGFDPADADYLLDILIGDDVIPAMASTGTLVLPPAVRGINFRITPIADADDEGPEAVEVIVSTITFTNGEMLSERLAATLNIADYGDLPTAALDITADTAEGGDSGVFTLTLDNAPNGPGIAEVSYSLAADADAFAAATFGGDADAGDAVIGDSTFTMTVADRTAIATLTITPGADDDATDDTVTFTVTGVTFADIGTGTDIARSSVTGTGISDGAQTLTIADDDPTTFTAVLIDHDDGVEDTPTSTVAERENLIVTLTLDRPLPGDGTVRYTILAAGSGDGIAAHDVSSTLNFGADNVHIAPASSDNPDITFTVDIEDDNRVEPDTEGGIVRLISVAWETHEIEVNTTLDFTIADNDGITLTLDAGEYRVRDNAETLEVTVNAAPNPIPDTFSDVILDRAVAATLTGTDDTAAAPADYTTVNTTFTFAAGTTELSDRTVSITIVDDADAEEQTFTLALDDSDRAVTFGTRPTATVTIVPNIEAGYDSTADIALIEGTGAESTARRTLTLTHAPDADATVFFALAGGEVDGGSATDPALIFTTGEGPMTPMINRTGPRANMSGSFTIPAANVGASVALNFGTFVDANGDDSTIMFTITDIAFEGDDSMTDITALDTLTITITDTSSRTDAVLNAVDPDVNASEINNATADAVLTLIGNAAAAGTATVSFELGGDAVFGTRSNGGFDPADADYLLDILIGDDVIPAMASTGTLVLPQDDTKINFRITPIADADDEGPEAEAVEVIVSTITFTNGEMLSRRLAATLNIADYGDLPTAALDVTADTAEGGGSGVFTLMLGNAPTGIAEVSYNLAADTDAFTAATFGGDADAGDAAIGDSAFTMTVAGRTAVATLAITPGADADTTDDTVTFTVTGVTFADIGAGTDIVRSSVTGTGISNGAQTLTITDDDPTTFTAVLIDRDDDVEDTPTSTIAERENLIVTLTLDRPLPGDGTVRYTILAAGSGDGIAAHDVSSTLNFGADNVHIAPASSDNPDITFTVDIEDDNRVEPDTEGGIVRLISVAWETHEIEVNTTLDFTIADNDGITLTLDAGEYSVNNNEETLTVTVNAAPNPSPSTHTEIILDRAVTATLTSTDGTAVSGTEGDYTAVNHVFNYAASASTQTTIPDQTIGITIVNDRDTPTETFTLTLDGSDRAVTLGTPPSATVTITGDTIIQGIRLRIRAFLEGALQ